MAEAYSFIQQTSLLTATILTPWAPVVIRLSVAIVLGGDDNHNLGAKTLREQLNIDATQGLKVKTMGRAARMRRLRVGLLRAIAKQLGLPTFWRLLVFLAGV